MKDGTQKRTKSGSNKRSVQKSDCAKARNDAPYWPQDKKAGGRGVNGVKSRPRSVGKRYWRM